MLLIIWAATVFIEFLVLEQFPHTSIPRRHNSHYNARDGPLLSLV